MSRHMWKNPKTGRCKTYLDHKGKREKMRIELARNTRYTNEGLEKLNRNGQKMKLSGTQKSWRYGWLRGYNEHKTAVIAASAKRKGPSAYNAWKKKNSAYKSRRSRSDTRKFDNDGQWRVDKYGRITGYGKNYRSSEPDMFVEESIAKNAVYDPTLFFDYDDKGRIKGAWIDGRFEPD